MRLVFSLALAICVMVLGIDLGAIGIHAQTVAPPDTVAQVLHWLGLAGGIAALGATLSTNALTLADHAKRLDPSGKISAIVELLSQSNEMLMDMTFMEGNLKTGHRTTVRTGLPAVAWRLINSGVTPSKSTTAQIDEQTGILEAWSEVDVDLAELSNDVAALRLSEARAFIEAMNQEMAQTVIYGNQGLAPEEFTGLAPRYSSLTAGNSDNVISAGGVQSDNTSIWLVAWGDDTVSGIFPSGSKAGLQHNDYGEQTIEVTSGVAGQRMRALQERWQWKAGIAVKDWRYAVRICNIDVSNLSGGSAADLIDMMEQAEETIPDGLGRSVFYMNRTVRRFLRRQLRSDVSAGGGLTYENVSGKRVYDFNGTPVRRLDAILNTEAQVT